MRFFDKDGKWNWVDENNVFVGYDNQQDCCEYAGYYISDSCPDVIDASRDGTANNFDYTAYRFDREFFREVGSGQGEGGGGAVFKLVSSGPDKYLVLFNVHNGYYGHGFEVQHNGLTLRSGIL